MSQPAPIAATEGRCFLCGAYTADVAWHENGHDAVACRCGLTFVHPMVPPNAVDPAHDGHPASFYRLPARLKVAWLSRHVPSGRLLDVGCGEGHFLEAARRAGFDAEGLDVNPIRVAAARARGFRVVQGLFEDTDLEGRYDVVFHCDLLSHFPDPVRALERMCALLAPAGVLFFEVGTLGGEARRWYPHIGGVGLPQHRWLYSEEALDRLLARAGLRVEARRRYGLGPLLWVAQVIRRVAPHVRRTLLREPFWRGRATSSDHRRTVRPALRARAIDGLERLDNFMRYRVGALAPGFGPGTMLVIAEPVEEWQ